MLSRSRMLSGFHDHKTIYWKWRVEKEANRATRGKQRATSQQPGVTSGQLVGNQRSTGSEVPSKLFTGFASPKFKNHEDYRFIGKSVLHKIQRQKGVFVQRNAENFLENQS